MVEASKGSVSPTLIISADTTRANDGRRSVDAGCLFVAEFLNRPIVGSNFRMFLVLIIITQTFSRALGLIVDELIGRVGIPFSCCHDLSQISDGVGISVREDLRALTLFDREMTQQNERLVQLASHAPARQVIRVVLKTTYS